jgi:hypothetical protein
VPISFNPQPIPRPDADPAAPHTRHSPLSTGEADGERRETSAGGMSMSIERAIVIVILVILALYVISRLA